MTHSGIMWPHLLGRIATWLWVTVTLLPSTALGQAEFPEASGRWEFAVIDRSSISPGTSPAEARAFVQKLVLAAMPFRHSLALARPRGVEILPLLRLVPTPAPPAPASRRPLAGEVQLQLFPLYGDCGGCPVKTSTTSITIHVWANFPEAAFAGSAGQQVEEDESGPMYLGPRLTDTIEEFPEYTITAASTRFVVITTNPRPLWLPVSRERLLRNDIRKARADLESVEKALGGATSTYQEWLAGAAERKRQREEMIRQLIQQVPADAAKWRAQAKELEQVELQVGEQLKAGEGQDRETRSQTLAQSRGVVTALETTLGALTAAERAAPAYIGEDGAHLSSAEGTDAAGAAMVVGPNPAFFDPALPKTAVQVLIVEIGPVKDQKFSGFLLRKLGEIQASLDWKRFTLAMGQ